MDLALKVKILTAGAQAPKRNRLGDAGFDLFGIESGQIDPGKSAKIRLGFATSFNQEYVGLVLDRGGAGFKGIMRRAGVIDSNFRGEWVVNLYNSGSEAFVYQSVLNNQSAKAIAQVVFLMCAQQPQAIIVQELSGSTRGVEGWGSSDSK